MALISPTSLRAMVKISLVCDVKLPARNTISESLEMRPCYYVQHMINVKSSGEIVGTGQNPQQMIIFIIFIHQILKFAVLIDVKGTNHAVISHVLTKHNPAFKILDILIGCPQS